MIIAEQKSLEELKTLIADSEKVLVVGCGTCVTVCFAGGAREAAISAASLRMATKLDGNNKQITDVTVQRQCEWEYLDQIAEQVAEVDVVLSLCCGIGVQAIAEGPFEAAAVHAMFLFQMPDARFNGGPTFHPAPQAFGRSAAPSLVHMNSDVSCVSMTSVAHVHEHMFRWTSNAFDLAEGVF